MIIMTVYLLKLVGLSKRNKMKQLKTIHITKFYLCISNVTNQLCGHFTCNVGATAKNRITKDCIEGDLMKAELFGKAFVINLPFGSTQSDNELNIRLFKKLNDDF